ncbi:MAG TPA: DMT family transporter [Jatrophihabitans sp.]|uniref:DMT family transporter n=1 Tax=Jatrophihabitans sp. TaxID=1932789 RepID=UPI002F0FEF86
MLAATMLFWGSGFSSSELMVDHMPHAVAALLRFGGGAVALLVVMSFLSRSGRTSARDWSRAAIAGFLEVFAYNLFFFWGLSLAPAVDASIIVPVMSPILTTAFMLLTRKEAASASRVTGLTIGLIGAAIFFLGASEGSGGSTRLVGDLLFLLSAACWAAYSVYGARVLGGMEPLKATTYAMLTGTIMLGFYASPGIDDVDWSGLSHVVWLNVAYVAIGPTAVAYLFYYRGVQAVGPSAATTMMFLVPVIGTFCSVVLLGESFGLLQAVGAVVLLAGAFLAVTGGRVLERLRGRPERPTAHDEAEVERALADGGASNAGQARLGAAGPGLTEGADRGAE